MDALNLFELIPLILAQAACTERSRSITLVPLDVIFKINEVFLKNSVRDCVFSVHTYENTNTKRKMRSD